MKINKIYNFKAESGLKVDVKLTNASILINGNDDMESQLTIYLESATKLPEGKELSDYFKFEYDEEKNELTFEQKEEKLPSLIKAVKVEMVIPEEAEVNTVSKNGGIKVVNIEGDQYHKATNGGIKAVGCEGRLELKTTNGGIKIIDHEGVLVIDQKNGAISVMDSEGEMELINKNGVIKLNNCSGKLKLENKNGGIKVLNAGFEQAEVISNNSSIYYEFEEIDEGKFNFENNNGRINLIIPQEIPYNISAKTQLGTINIGLDKSYEQKGDGQKEFTLTNGEGSVVIKAENNRGGINILDELHKSEGFESKISHKIEVMLKDKIVPAIETLTKENAPKVEEQIKKVGEKLSKIEINIPDIESKIKKVVAQVTESINVNLEENSEDIEKVKKSAINTVNTTWDNITSTLKTKKDKSEETRQDEVNERSRLKILELLENGKITPDEAERLLKALGIKDDA